MRRLIQRITYIYGIAVLLFSSCGGKGSTLSAVAEGDTLTLRYAENLTVVTYPDYTVATLRNPWDTLKTLHTYILVSASKALPEQLPEGTIVRTPLRKSLIYSSVHCSLLEQLGALDAIGGICERRFIYIDAIQQGCDEGRIVDCGDSMSPDIERIIDLHPDAILLSPFENSGGYGRVEKLDIPLIECADYMETSALGRAEWMRFYGMLFGVTQQADSLFAEVESNYLRLKQLAKDTDRRPTLFCDTKTGSVWYQPGGHSTMGRLYADANGAYVFAETTVSGSIPLPFEAVFDKAENADVWIIRYNSNREMTYSDLAADFAGNTGFKAFKERNVYACNTSAQRFYEEAPFRPDYLLADFIQILHPELGDLGGFRYFRRINKE